MMKKAVVTLIAVLLASGITRAREVILLFSILLTSSSGTVFT